MKTIDLQGMTNMELVRGGTDEWYWSTDYIHGDLYEAEELFHMGHPVQSNRLYLIHYPDGTVYEPVPAVAGQYLGYPVYDNGAVALLVVNFPEGIIRILRFQPGETAEIAQIPLSAVKDCYNLILHTAPLTLTRTPGDGTFEVIWPEQICFLIEERETLNFRDRDKLYFTIWYEDPDYREETIVRSLRDGTILDRFSGDIRIMPNIMTDLQKFDRLWEQAQKNIPVSHKAHLLKRAIHLYRGTVFETACDDHWLVGIATEYKLKYIGLVNELLALLAKYDDYNGINTFATQALKLTPENIKAYYWLIYAMYHSGAIELAKNEAQRAKSILTSEEYTTLKKYLLQDETLAYSQLFAA